MYTYEIVKLADENGKTYKCNDLFYNTNEGFHESNGDKWNFESWNHHNDPLSCFIHESRWEEVKIPEYSHKELRDKIGHEFTIKKDMFIDCNIEGITLYYDNTIFDIEYNRHNKSGIQTKLCALINAINPNKVFVDTRGFGKYLYEELKSKCNVNIEESQPNHTVEHMYKSICNSEIKDNSDNNYEGNCLVVDDLRDIPVDYCGDAILEKGKCRTEYICTGDGNYYRPRS